MSENEKNQCIAKRQRMAGIHGRILPNGVAHHSQQRITIDYIAISGLVLIPNELYYTDIIQEHNRMREDRDLRV